MTTENFSVVVGENGILGVGAHLSIGFRDEAGQIQVEINGLATTRDGVPRKVGFGIRGDTIDVYNHPKLACNVQGFIGFRGYRQE